MYGIFRADWPPQQPDQHVNSNNHACQIPFISRPSSVLLGKSFFFLFFFLTLFPGNFLNLEATTMAHGELVKLHLPTLQRDENGLKGAMLFVNSAKAQGYCSDAADIFQSSRLHLRLVFWCRAIRKVWLTTAATARSDTLSSYILWLSDNLLPNCLLPTAALCISL